MTANRARWMIALALALTALAAPAARAGDAYVANRQLVVYGSSAPDSIGVVEDVGRNTLTVIVLDMTTYATVLNRTFRRSDVDTVYINPLDGDDYAYNFTTLPGSIEGWGGDDFLWGGTAGDDLWGDSSYYAGIGGDDTIHGQGGNDAIHGGPGDDALFGHGGTDRIEGGSGNDTLTQVASTSVVTDPMGNKGKAFFFSSLGGDDGNDVISIGTSWSMVDGGRGFDRFLQGAEVQPRSVQGGIYYFTYSTAFNCESWAYVPAPR